MGLHVQELNHRRYIFAAHLISSVSDTVSSITLFGGKYQMYPETFSLVEDKAALSGVYGAKFVG